MKHEKTKPSTSADSFTKASMIAAAGKVQKKKDKKAKAIAKASQKLASAAANKETVESAFVKQLPAVRHSDDAPPRKLEWINRERVLFVPCRGVSSAARHWMLDMLSMMPHGKREAKFQSKRVVDLVQLAETHNCTKLVFLETRKHLLNYVWFVCLPDGPSVKCLMEGNSSVRDLRLTGNALKHSRPLLVFSEEFASSSTEEEDALVFGNTSGKATKDGGESGRHNSVRRLMREVLTQVFGTPKEHPKSQPFIDKMFQFAWLDGRIWFRSYQLDMDENGAPIEMGPRFCLKVLNVFANPFGGATIYKNPQVLTPADKRNIIQAQKADVYCNRLFAKKIRQAKPGPVDEEHPTNRLFE